MALRKSDVEIIQRRKDVRRILWQWGDTMRLCQRKLEEIHTLQAMIDDARHLRAVTMDGMPRARKSGDPTANTAISMDNVITNIEAGVAKIEESIGTIMRLKVRIDDALEGLPVDQQRVIELRYKDGNSWLSIGLKMGRDESGVRWIERCAVDTLTECVDIQTKP